MLFNITREEDMQLREETLDSKLVFDGKLVKLRVDTVRLPDGKEAIREIVVHRGAVAMVPLLDHDRIVMVRQYRQAAGEILLEIPAGTSEPDEEPYACADRELQEETGYRAGRIAEMFSSYLAPGYSSEMLHTFLAEDLTKVQSQTDEDEFVEVVEVSMDEAVDLIRTGGIKDAKTICGVLMAQRIVVGRER